MESDKNDISDHWLLRISPQVHLVGYHHAPRDWCDGGRVIADHALQAPGAGGHLTVRVGREVFECPYGTFLIVPPDVWTVRAGPRGRGFTRHWVHFDWVWRADWPLRPWRQDTMPADHGPAFGRRAPAFLPGGVLHGPIPRLERFFQDFERLNERFHFGTAGEKLGCRGLLLEMLTGLFAGADESATDEPTPAARRIRHALRRLANLPFAEAPPIRSYLADRGTSYDHQARLFREAYGVTPLTYVNSLRVSRAQALLTDTDYPIKHIAHELGFADPGYFDRLFKKHTGVSPSRFRQGPGSTDQPPGSS